MNAKQSSASALPKSLRHLKTREIVCDSTVVREVPQYISRIEHKRTFAWYVRPPMLDGQRTKPPKMFSDGMSGSQGTYRAFDKAVKYLASAYINFKPKNRIKPMLTGKKQKVLHIKGKNYTVPIGVSFRVNNAGSDEFNVSVPSYSGKHRNKTFTVSKKPGKDFKSQFEAAIKCRLDAEAAYEKERQADLEKNKCN